MRPRRLAGLATPIVVLAASQVGHLLAWELRQGPRALALDRSGAHGYVPGLMTVALGAAGALCLAALLLVAGARAAGAGRPRAIAGQRRAPSLERPAVLFALQLAVFLLQEILEAAVGGRAMPSAVDLLLWGSLGQLPAAFLAALVLSWAGPRVEAAVAELADAAGRPLMPPRPARSPRVWLPAQPDLRPRPTAPAVRQRGPPALPRPR